MHLSQITEEVCVQANLPLDKFLEEISGLCESLSLIAKDCCDYQDKDLEKLELIKDIMERCFMCADEMLNYCHEQGVYQYMCSKYFPTPVILNPIFTVCILIYIV